MSKRLENTFNRLQWKLTIVYAAVSLTVILVYNGLIISSQYLAGTQFRRTVGEDVTISVQISNPSRMIERPLPHVIETAFREYERDIQEKLFFIDAIIIICTVIAGYFLNRYLLKPIRQFASEQEEFIANASHELKTPLTTIKAEIAALEQTRKKFSKEEKESLTVIKNEIVTMSGLTTNLLTMSTMDQSDNKIKVDLVLLTKKKIEALKKNLQPKKLKIKFDYKQDILCNVNPTFYNQLLDILIDNAIKYASAQTIILIKLYKQKNNVGLQVIDKGVVISDYDKEKIFERFYRATNRETMKENGSGLGLAIARTLVEKMDGRIILSKSDEKETIFTVILPL